MIFAVWLTPQDISREIHLRNQLQSYISRIIYESGVEIIKKNLILSLKSPEIDTRMNNDTKKHHPQENHLHH